MEEMLRTAEEALRRLEDHQAPALLVRAKTLRTK